MCTPLLTRRQLLFAHAPGLLLVLAGCSGEADKGPAEVRWGKENCTYCGMIIDNPRFATQIRGGEPRKLWKFDDPGCGALWLDKQSWGNEGRTEFWVGESETGSWIDGRDAWFVSGQKSPMGYDYGAVKQMRDGGLSFASFRQAVIASGSRTQCLPALSLVQGKAD
ncbi:MAG: hypothetical protein HQL45_05055 [Alphaproteobacteria bacterium]|nr:hypothetical protein [Alphaproteobacteria bacterium]